MDGTDSCNRDFYGGGQYANVSNLGNIGHTEDKARYMSQRIASDVYFAMTEPSNNNRLSMARASIVKRAFYEWDSTERGLTSMSMNLYSPNHPSNRAAPFCSNSDPNNFDCHTYIAKNMSRRSSPYYTGTKYDAENNEPWCTEFVNDIYNTFLGSDREDSDWEDTVCDHVECQNKVFGDHNKLYKSTNIFAMFYYNDPGNYLSYIKPIEDSEEKAKHSAILLTLRERDFKTWIIHGNWSNFENAHRVSINLIGKGYHTGGGLFKTHDMFDYLGVLYD